MGNKIREKIRKELWTKREGVCKYSDKYKYYVSDWKENVVGTMNPDHQKMFEEASGDELEDKIYPAKAKAIDSSSMISYNFFRNVGNKNPITIDEIVYDEVFFEVKLPTLKTSNAPANIDVVLISKDKQSALFIESKFLEYLECKRQELSNSYKNIDKSYFDDSKEKEDLLTMANLFDKYNRSGHYNYGIKQNICHLFGISNLSSSQQAKEVFRSQYKGRHQEEICDATIYHFMNLLFAPSNPDAKGLYNQYVEDLNGFRDDLPDSIKKRYIGKTFILTYRDLFDNLSNELDAKKELQKYYIELHE